MQVKYYSFLITATLLLNYTFINTMRPNAINQQSGCRYYQLSGIQENPATGDETQHLVEIERDDIFPFQVTFANALRLDDIKFKKTFKSLLEEQALKEINETCTKPHVYIHGLEKCIHAPESCFGWKTFINELWDCYRSAKPDRFELVGSGAHLESSLTTATLLQYSQMALKLFTRAICGLKKDGPTSHIARTKIIKQLIDFFPLHEQYRIDLNAGQEETRHETLIDLIHAVAHGNKVRFFPYGLLKDEISPKALENARNEIADGASQKEPLYPTIVALAAEKDMRHLIKSGFLDELQGLFDEPNLLMLIAQFYGYIRCWDLMLVRRLWQEAGYEEADEIYDCVDNDTRDQGSESDSSQSD